MNWFLFIFISYYIDFCDTWRTLPRRRKTVYNSNDRYGGVIDSNEERQETYTPKMKPGDVEIPNRVFVKVFPKETVADELFTHFEKFGKVIECRIVADHYGNSKGSSSLIYLS